MKDENFTAKKMHLNHAFKAFSDDGVGVDIWSNWIPKLCGSGGMMCHQHPNLINDMYAIVLSTVDKHNETNLEKEEV